MRDVPHVNKHQTSFSEGLPAAKPLPVKNIPEDFARNLVLKISDELKAHIEGRSSEVRVMMKPEAMGELSLRVMMEDGKLAARMEVSQMAVKVALEAQLPQLREALVQQGIDVQRFDIVSDNTARFDQSKEGSAFHQRQSAKRLTEADQPEQFDTVKFFGYNTVEYII
jgi:flagellar hook-length control protein FliK